MNLEPRTGQSHYCCAGRREFSRPPHYYSYYRRHMLYCGVFATCMQEISLFLKMGGAIKAELITGLYQLSDLPQSGLKEPCMLILEHLGWLCGWSPRNQWQQCIHRLKKGDPCSHGRLSRSHRYRFNACKSNSPTLMLCCHILILCYVSKLL